MDRWLALRYYHWMFLAQSGDMPRRLISADRALFLHFTFAGLSGSVDMFDTQALANYERAAHKPDVVAAWCGDDTAAATIGLDHDR